MHPKSFTADDGRADRRRRDLWQDPTRPPALAPRSAELPPPAPVGTRSAFPDAGGFERGKSNTHLCSRRSHDRSSVPDRPAGTVAGSSDGHRRLPLRPTAPLAAQRRGHGFRMPQRRARRSVRSYGRAGQGRHHRRPAGNGRARHLQLRPGRRREPSATRRQARRVSGTLAGRRQEVETEAKTEGQSRPTGPAGPAISRKWIRRLRSTSRSGSSASAPSRSSTPPARSTRRIAFPGIRGYAA